MIWLRSFLLSLCALAFAGSQVACACAHEVERPVMDMSMAGSGHDHCEDMAPAVPQEDHGMDHDWKACEHAAQLKTGTAQVQLAQLTTPDLIDLPAFRTQAWEELPEPSRERAPEIRPPPPDPPSARKTVFLT